MSKNIQGEVHFMTTSGVAISTYFCDVTPEIRLNVFKKSINSLIVSEYKGPIFLVDDGSTKKDHLNFVREVYGDRIFIQERSENGGLSKVKNTGIRLLMENKCDIGFLVDDDMEYLPNWFTAYEEAISKTGIPHFSFYWNKGEYLYENTTYNDYGIIKTALLSGCFLTITGQLINDIGYFRILPTKVGHEHTNFTLRAIHHKKIPYFCDIADSEKYLMLIPESGTRTSVGGVRDPREDEIGALIARNLDVIHPCIE